MRGVIFAAEPPLFTNPAAAEGGPGGSAPGLGVEGASSPPVYLISGHYYVSATAIDREEWPRNHA